jgi:integrase
MSDSLPWPPNVPRNFKLTLVKRGYMARINGRPTWIAGKVTPDEAMAAYHRKAGALTTGNEPMPAPRGTADLNPPLKYVLSRWLVERRGDAQRGELSPNAYGQYRLSAQRIDRLSGHVLLEDWNPDATRALYERFARAHGTDLARRAVGHLRTCLRHAAEMGWCKDVRMGDRVVARLAARPQATMKWRLYTPTEVRMILAELDRQIDAADGRRLPSLTQLRAMVYLALNGGYGATELAELPRSAVDLAGARIEHRRGKTGMAHVVPLWPETVKALRPVMAQRPGDDLVFRTRQGGPWCYRRGVTEGRVLRVIGTDNCNDAFNNLVRPMGL